MSKTRKIKVVGAGGIGGHLIEPLCRYLNCTEDSIEITVFDGDKFEERNRSRQRFNSCDNKADHTVARLREEFPRIHFRSKGEYLTEDNIILSIRDGDVVFACVDNHATRKLISDRCDELNNVVLISGGNDYTDGNVIVYIRENGKALTKSPSTLHPKIALPEDKNPGNFTDIERQGCQREAETNPQLLFMNLAIASAMCNCYYAYEQKKVHFEQVYVDILTQKMRPSP
jgi:molybdopterin/thiamine biosynthesis adenylyltransferase